MQLILDLVIGSIVALLAFYKAFIATGVVSLFFQIKKKHRCRWKMLENFVQFRFTNIQGESLKWSSTK